MSRQIAHTDFFTTQDWPEDCFIQGGQNGLVFDRSHPQGSYTTDYFFEVFPTAPATFIRGEGRTMAQAEEQAWDQWRQRLSCPDYATNGKHSFEARGYRNGAGFCAACNLFASKVFTGEDLGQFCHVCGVGTTWGQDTLGRWRCQEHMVHSRQRVAQWADMRQEPMIADPDEPSSVGTCAFCAKVVRDSAEGARDESGPDSILSRMAIQCPAVDIPAFTGDGVVPGRHALVVMARELAGEGTEVIEVGIDPEDSSPRLGEYVAVEFVEDGLVQRAPALVKDREEGIVKIEVWWDFAVLC